MKSCRCTPLLVGLALAMLDAAPASAAEGGFDKPAMTVLGWNDSRTIIEVKFRNDDDTRLRDGRWVSRQRGALAGLDALTATAGPVDRIEPLFSADVLAADAKVAGRARAGLPALHQWYRMHLRSGEDIAQVVERLNAMDAVDIAYPAPLPSPPPSSLALPGPAASPLLVARQGYASAAATNGIDAAYARTVPGGDGTGIRVVDIEYSWNWQHEDLTKLRVPGTWIKQGSVISDPFNDNGHGTAVLGEMVADDNGHGVRGLVNGATPHYVNVTSPQTGYNVGNAVLLAGAKLSAGDVILIEQQFPGPSPCTGFVAPEWIPSIYDAVVSVVRRGIHVVETAGNGNVNLDAPCFGRGFPYGRPDSGAILAGAGGSSVPQWCQDRVPARSRQGFSTYGRRVNLQGWGNCVASTGYGQLYNGGRNALYTQTFSGTSSAGPIVASAVAAVSGVAKARGLMLSPLQMRDLLTSTGTPQVGNNGHIGPLPNLRAAITKLDAMP